MIDKLIEEFLKYASLSQAETEAIIKSTEIKEFKKGEILLKEGHTSRYSYFVLKGCVRQYNLSDGNERTTRFFTEEEWILSVDETSENPVSIHNWICMEHCVLVIGNEQKAQALFENYPRLESISRKIVETAFSEIQKKYYILLFRNT
jgi:CRP-like cAMP-binding protein